MRNLGYAMRTSNDHVATFVSSEDMFVTVCVLFSDQAGNQELNQVSCSLLTFRLGSMFCISLTFIYNFADI